MLHAALSLHSSVIALENGEPGREVGVEVSGETRNKKVFEWINQVPVPTLDGDLRRTRYIISTDKPAGEAGTAGRISAITEDNEGTGGSLPDDLRRENKAADLAADVLAHLTISQDQTSGSQLSRENLAALTKPTDKADVTSVSLIPMHSGISKDGQGHYSAAELDVIMSPSIRSHSAGSQDTSEDSPFTLGHRGRQSAPLESSLAPRRPREKLPRKIINLKAESSSDSLSTEEKPSEYAISMSNDVVEDQAPHETWVPESIVEDSHQRYDSMEDLLSRLKDLERENNELRNGTTEEIPHPAPPPVPHYTWRTFYSIENDIFLESPQWRQGERKPILHTTSPLQNVRFYLEQHPEIAFVFYKDYDPFPPADNSKTMSKDGVFRTPEPFKQTLMLTSEHMISAVEKLADHIPDFADYFPDCDPYNEIPAPYMYINHCMPLFDHVIPHLTPLENGLLEQLNESVLADYGPEYLAAKRRAAKGMVSRQLVKYLVRRGDVLVRTQDTVPRAYVATTWARESRPGR